MGLLNSQDKEIIKRALPKSSNKIIDVTVARLYIAYPDKTQWQYTGLSGAITLVDDLVGHTFFLKLIDIFGHRGIVWDQELYVNFQYYQDRTFFHTFEIEDCYVGLLFIDINEAQHFLKRVQKREKYASRATLQNKKAIALTKKLRNENSRKAPKQGPRGETVVAMDSQRKRYNYDNIEHIPTTKNKAPPPPPPPAGVDDDEYEEEYNNVDDELGDDYYNDDYNEEDTHTIHSKPAIASMTKSPEQPASSTTNDTSQEKEVHETEPPARTKHSVPPLPANFQMAPPLSNPNNMNNQPAFNNQQNNNGFPAPVPQNNGFPIPMPQNNGMNPNMNRPVPQLPNRNNQPMPIPMQMNGMHTGRPVPQLPNRNNNMSMGAGMNMIPSNGNGVPPPPPARRGPAPPLPPHRNNPNMNIGMNQRLPSNGNGPAPPPPPMRRGPAPPPPPTRSRPQQPMPFQQQQQQQQHMSYGQQGSQPLFNQQMPQTSFGQPTSPPQQQSTPPTTFGQPAPPPQQQQQQLRQVPGMPPTTFNQSPQLPTAAPMAPSLPPIGNTTNASNTIQQAPPLPPMMGNNAAPVAPPPPPMMGNNTAPVAPPPPPMMGNNTAPVAPPPPPMMGNNNVTPMAPPAPAMSAANNNFSESTGDAGRDALLASIRGAGGIGALKKVDKSQLDKPSVLLQEARGEPVSNGGSTTNAAPSGAAGVPPGQASLADALAAALNKRKNKVGAHEDDDDGADDW